MKKLLCMLMAAAACAACAPKEPPVSLIFDTDMAPDYDDVGALAVLHALADSGEVRISLRFRRTGSRRPYPASM